MKHFSLFLFVLVFIFSCSDSDNSETDNSNYWEISVLGETYRYEASFYATQDSYLSCETDDYDDMGFVYAWVENSSIYAGMHLFYDVTESLFQNYDINDSNLIIFDGLSDDCYNTFDADIELYLESSDSNLGYDYSSNNFNKINKISLYKEDNQKKIYAVNGEFQITYLDIDGSKIPVSGKYNLLFDVLN